MVNYIFSAVVAASTVAYAILTWRLVKETAKMREAQVEPRVSVTLRYPHGKIQFLDIVVENVGLGPAYDIKIAPKEDFECQRGRMMSNIGFIKNGIKYLAPKDERTTFFTALAEDHEKKISTSLELLVEYDDYSGKRHQEKSILNLSEFSPITVLGKSPLAEVADALKSIEKSLEHLVNEISELKIKADMNDESDE